MTAEDREEFTKHMGLQPHICCARHLSHVRRPRLYWFNLQIGDHADLKIVNQKDAAALQLPNDETIAIAVNGKTVAAKLHLNGDAPEGVALLRGVPYQAGIGELKLGKIED